MGLEKVGLKVIFKLTFTLMYHWDNIALPKSTIITGKTDVFFFHDQKKNRIIQALQCKSVEVRQWNYLAVWKFGNVHILIFLFKFALKMLKTCHSTYTNVGQNEGR